MRYFSLFFVCHFIIFLSNCSTDSSSQLVNISFEGTFNRAGLEGITVNSFNDFEGDIYASTSNGLYRKPEASTESSWISLGLTQESVLDVVFLPDMKLLAAVRISDFSGGIPSLYLSDNQGQNWRPFINNYGGETGEYTWVGALAAASKPSNTLFSRVGGTTVVRSNDGAKSWNVVNGQWNFFGGAAVLVKADPYHKTRVWAGGVNAFSFPYLLTSEDGGETWKNLENVMTSSQVCYDVLSHPQEKNLILAGLFGGGRDALVIRKSTDGGNSWKTVNEGFGTLTLVNSARDPQAVFASGRSPDGTLFFAASPDFGDTWEQVPMPNSPPGMQVNDMVSVMVEGREVLYFGTNKGVYSYTFEE